jgi:hypothetical protein
MLRSYQKNPLLGILLQNVIFETGRKFVCGEVFSQEVVDSQEANSKVKRRGELNSIYDDRFILEANVVSPGLIASAGPIFSNMGEFLEDTILNEKINITHIIALGMAILPKDNYYNFDFHDYCLLSRKQTYERQVLKIVDDQNSSEVIAKYDVTIENESIGLSPGFCNSVQPSSMGQSKLTVSVSRKDTLGNWSAYSTPKTLKVTVIPVDDMRAISVDDGGYTISALWKLYEQFLARWQDEKNYTVVHCHAGMGRTGHLILIFEILRHYDKIFSDDDHVRIAKEINAIVTEIRRTRPGLILLTMQLNASIRIACLLRRYAIENNFIQLANASQIEEEKSPTPQVSLSKLSQYKKSLFPINLDLAKATTSILDDLENQYKPHN